jgi:hypothetical protein
VTAVTPEQVAEVLACPMGENDADAATVRDYLVALLRELWEAEDGFSGKRPFGNSGWQTGEVYRALRLGGVVDDTLVRLDEDGYVESCVYAPLERLMLAAIDSLGKP